MIEQKRIIRFRNLFNGKKEYNSKMSPILVGNANICSGSM